VQNWVNLQNQENIHHRYYSIVDYHALTQKYVGSNVDEADDDAIEKFRSE
jgi:tryptophanyl-tRNA synthetase